MRFCRITLVYRTPLSLERPVVNLLYHLEAFLSSFHSLASFEMTVQEAQTGVLKLEPYTNCTLRPARPRGNFTVRNV
jgi:hypothetical protein